MTFKTSAKLYRTGEIAPHNGRYEFVQYGDGTTSPAPTVQERVIPLNRGDRFPPIKSSGKDAYWKAL
jgi:hypothetical protein